MEETKIVVICKGGLVTSVHSNNKNVKIAVVDYDSEDWTENGEPGATVEGSACVGIQKPDSVKKDLTKVFNDGSSEDNYVAKYLKDKNF